jgi:hypothetical protein
MGEIIDSVDISKGRPPKYPWELWTDQKARRLHQGKDFDATLESFRTMVHRKARDMGMRAHTKINEADSSIQVQFLPKDRRR